MPPAGSGNFVGNGAGGMTGGAGLDGPGFGIWSCSPGGGAVGGLIGTTGTTGLRRRRRLFGRQIGLFGCLVFLESLGACLRFARLAGTHFAGLRFRLRVRTMVHKSAVHGICPVSSPQVDVRPAGSYVAAEAEALPFVASTVAAKKPNVHALARARDEFGLTEAAGYAPPDDARGADPEAGAAIREQAVLALGALGENAGSEAVVWALQDTSERVRAAAVQVLAGRRQSGQLAAALAWLEAGTESHRLAIDAILELQAVMNAGEPDVARTVTQALVRARGNQPLGDEVPELLRMLIAAETGSSAQADVVAELLSALADERDAVAVRAQHLLPYFAEESIEGLVAELRGSAAPRRAAEALGRTGDPRALEPLADTLQHPDPRVRAQCAVALGQLRHPAAVEALLMATHDADYDVRTSAGAALDQLGTVGIVAGVAALLRPLLADGEHAAESNGSPASVELDGIA